uniref:Transcription repressor n=1 Tax=Oryza meridionalis TaxID=40149 RepID=A0A0E0F0A9_9ORYZ
MKMMTLRRGGGGAAGIRIKKKARGFMCGGCGGSKAVSVSDGSDKQSPMATPPPNTSSTTTTTTTTGSAGNKTTAAAGSSSFSPSHDYDYVDTDADADTSVGSTPSVAALLRQLGELERSVRSLQGAVAEGRGAKNVDGRGGGRRHRRTVSDGGGGGSGRVEESVAVVKESADPLFDFRRSMLQMIVEKEIVGGAELRELLHRFLSLNSPHHHHVILRAFAEIWEEVFAGYERTPDFLVSSHHRRPTKKKLPSSYAAADDDDDDSWNAA